MVVLLKKGLDKKAIQKSLQKLAKKSIGGGFDAHLFAGKLKRGLDGVNYQVQARDEWN